MTRHAAGTEFSSPDRSWQCSCRVTSSWSCGHTLAAITPSVGVSGRWVDFGACSYILRVHTGARWHAGEQLTTPRVLQPQRTTTEGDWSRVNIANTRSLILLPRTSVPGLFQKPETPPKILPPPHHAPPLFFSLSVILQQEKGRPFVVAHSVTQTQDLRLPVVKWKLSLGLSLCSLCSCRLEERGGNSYFSTWKGSRRGHEGRLFTSDTIDFESRRFSESSRECLLGCWRHVLIEFDCQQVSKGSKQAVFHKINLLWKRSSGILLQ